MEFIEVARPTLSEDSKKFVVTLRKQRARVGNGFLKAELGWSDDRYWRIHAHLREGGRIVPGRGRGGSVALA